MERVYRTAGPVLLRAARARVEDAPEYWPDLAGDSPEELCSWVRHVWRDPIATAVGEASPSLAATVERVHTGEALSARKVRRAATALVGYLLRASGRSTPFGLFAGTAAGSFARGGTLRWGSSHHVESRTDTAWLEAAVAELEALPELVERLWVVVNNQCRWRGQRIELPAGEHRVELVSSAPVRTVVTAASTPTPATEVVAHLRSVFPAATSHHVLDLISGLLAHGFLLSSLRPSSTSADPLAHARDELSRCAAEEIPAASAVMDRLGAAASSPTGSRASAQADEGATAHGEIRLDCEVAVPQQLGAEVEAGVSTLLRLSPHPGGHPVWRQYYEAFVHRYGAGALVPLLELVDADMGLGYPPTYPGSLMPSRPQEPPPRESSLLQIAQEATATGAEEIVLDQEEIHRLAVAPLDPQRIPPHVEVGVWVSAPSMEAIEAGNFTVRIRPGRAVGTFTGRFTPATSEMAETYRCLPTVVEGAVAAQLVFPALRPSAGNLARTPRFLDQVICLGEYPPEGAEVLALQDLAVMADRHQLHLVHTPTHRIVEPQVLHALSLDHQAPPLARFLAHLTRGCLTSFTRVDWGAATALPFLPRLRHGHTVLSPKRWRLQTNDLPPRSADHKEWRSALQRWRTIWRVPAHVELAQGDQVLPLHLDEPAHTDLLRTRLHAAGHVFLTETDHPDGLGWIEGHAHELAVPLATTTPRAESPLERPVVHTRDSERGQPPAAPRTEWLYAKIYAHPQRHTEILTEYLPELLEETGTPAWWFVRYRAPDDPDHLRLRLRVDTPDQAAKAATSLGRWSERLRRDGLSPRLCLDTYYPETGRYGDGALLEAAEAVFTADSTAVLHQLEGPAPEARVEVAATMGHIAAALTGEFEAGMRWLIDHPGKRPSSALPRELHDETSARIEPAHALLPGELHDALTRYRHLLTTMAGPPLDGVISSLLHMHHNRALGIDRDSERTCRHLARQAALSRIARNEAAP
ncbi:lantibiotic dehydratase [Halostreptopolyspora alba]